MTRLEAFCCAVLLALLAILIVTAPAQEPVILHPIQQEDPHDGQPEICTNAKGAPKKHACTCHKEPGEDGEGCARDDKKCRTYCRPKACGCFQPKCDS